MDLEKFSVLFNRPGRTREELKNLYSNALSKGEAEYAEIAKQALDTRFPRWKKRGSKAAGKRA